jgi:ubiquitin C-terminal hydrolase
MTTNRSIVDKVFSGQFSSMVYCKACGEESVTYLPFVDLCIGIADGTLEGCLKKHFELESNFGVN